MKVRINGNKLRLRLKQFEVKSFQEKGTVSETMSFGTGDDQQLKFVMTKGGNTFAVSQSGTHIQITVPASVADNWTSTGMVGFEETVTANHGGQIALLVEKDFECVDGSDDDNAGTYPNPRIIQSAP
jgi:hypothetical protein